MPVDVDKIVEQRLYLVQVEGPGIRRGEKLRYSLSQKGDLTHSASATHCVYITTPEIPRELIFTMNRLVEQSRVFGGRSFRLFTTLAHVCHILEDGATTGP